MHKVLKSLVRSFTPSYRSSSPFVCGRESFKTYPIVLNEGAPTFRSLCGGGDSQLPKVPWILLRSIGFLE